MANITSALFGLALLSSTGAFGDQCQWVNRDDALVAVKKIKLGQTIYHFCEQCGESDPTPVTVKAAIIKREGAVEASNWGLLINGKYVDLAYTYIAGPGKDLSQYQNLGMLTSCDVQGASEFIQIGG